MVFSIGVYLRSLYPSYQRIMHGLVPIWKVCNDWVGIIYQSYMYDHPDDGEMEIKSGSIRKLDVLRSHLK